MGPFQPKGLPGGALALADPGRDYLVWAPVAGPITLDLSDREETFAAYRIDTRTGEARQPGEVVRGGKTVEIPVPGSGMCLVWLTRK
jgi:hypothetical protein